jgi:hypothetical protein
MSNMPYEHRDHEKETYSNKTKSRKEFNRGNYSDDNDTLPRYSSLKPEYNDNNPWLSNDYQGKN